MNEQHIEDIITVLYDMIQDARSLPLNADKCILERDRALDMLDAIIQQLPTELRDSRKIMESRNELIGHARREADEIIRKAQEQAAQMVSQEKIVVEAKRYSEEILAQNQVRLAEIRKASNDYMDDALRRTEEAISQSLE
jgi:vacuolar-type H+-ATPase subunit H